ncbi:MAG: hypothetical protein FJ108_11845 [Deltaproteobacteria bacterium]|nr:hypothetical protein [Deltaproteobacteria bacterium]
MDVLVCVQAVTHEPPRLVAGDGAPRFERRGRSVLNESDAYAVDTAVFFARRTGGRTTAVTVGPLAAQEVLYLALAKGANEALRVDAAAEPPLEVARALAAVVRRGRYDLVLTGVESSEALASAVGPALAGFLDWPFASAVQSIGVGVHDDHASVMRETGGGGRQQLSLALPAVLCVQSGIGRLSYPPAVRVLQARRQAIQSLAAAELGLEIAAVAPRATEAFAPRRDRDVELLEGSPAEIAVALCERIARARGLA